MKGVIVFFLIVVFYGKAYSQVEENKYDSLVNLFQSFIETEQEYVFIKTIVVGNKGCNIQSSTTSKHSGQIGELRIPIPNGVKLKNLKCDDCIRETLNENYEVLKVFSKELSFGIFNDCLLNDNTFSISEDSLYTLTNLEKKYRSMEELEKIQGFGSTVPFTYFYLSVYLHHDFEFVSIKENDESNNFIFKEDNYIVFKTKNIQQFGFEVKYRRKRPEVQVVSRSILVDGDVTLKIYDANKEDGDVINLFVNKRQLLDNYEAVNTSKIIHLKNREDNLIKIENISEGTIPPNTVIVEVQSAFGTEKVEVRTSKSQSFEIKLKRK